MTLPKVTVVMAVYKPQHNWFIEQLESLNDQTYKGDIELLIWNDSPKVFSCIDVVKKYITNFAYKIFDNGKNNGSARAFEELSRLAEGKYIAYCDQDDIWLPEKIEKSVAIMEKNIDVVICHGNMEMVNKNKVIIKTHPFPKLASEVNNLGYQHKMCVVKNYAFGCAMLTRTDFIKEILPFPNGVYHDQWIICCGAYSGKVVFFKDNIIKHRIHDNNHSKKLRGIFTKKQYYDIKLMRDYALINALVNRYGIYNTYLFNILKWVKNRKEYSEKCNLKNFFNLFLDKEIRIDIVIFELILPFIPEYIFAKLMKWFHN